jgi:hypothetical protein
VLNEIATRPHLNIHVQNMWQNGYPPPISIKLTMNTRFQSMLVTWQQVDEPNIAPNNLYLQKYQTLEVYVQNILVAKESNIDMSQQKKNSARRAEHHGEITVSSKYRNPSSFQII